MPGWSRTALAAAAAPRPPRAEQVPSSLGVSCARGARVPPPEPTSPSFVNSRVPTVPLPGVERECRSGPQAARARVAAGVWLFPPALLQRRQPKHPRCAKRDVSSQAESASPARGARALCPPGGRQRPHRCTAAWTRAAPSPPHKGPGWVGVRTPHPEVPSPKVAGHSADESLET